MKNKQSLKKDERGIASVVITMVIIMILSLFVLAMARNAQREQRQALDRQLSSQALYAAESGVNDTVEYIRSHLSDPDLKKKKTECGGDNPTLAQLSGNTTNPGQVGADAAIKYTCVLYDRQPPTIELSNVSSDTSTIVPIQNANATGINTLSISWDNPDSTGGNFNCPSGGSLPRSDNYSCDIGMLRVELISASTGSLTRAALIDKDFTAFIYPGLTEFPVASRKNSTGVLSGIFATGGCTSTGAPRKCTVHINDMDIAGDGRLYLRIKTLYKPRSSVVISGTDRSTSSAPVNFSGAQILVDVTGKASDVLKRIQVRRQVMPSFNQSDYGIKTNESLCKLVDVYPGFSADNCSSHY